jgi:hypothetical protein
MFATDPYTYPTVKLALDEYIRTIDTYDPGTISVDTLRHVLTLLEAHMRADATVALAQAALDTSLAYLAETP